MKASLFLLLALYGVSFGELLCKISEDNEPKEIKIECTDTTGINIDHIMATKVQSAKNYVDLGLGLHKFDIRPASRQVYYYLNNASLSVLSESDYKTQHPKKTTVNTEAPRASSTQYTFSIENITIEGTVHSDYRTVSP
jgi:hypothetical protein